MERLHAGLPQKDFSRPDSIVSVTLCSDSHKPAVPGVCPRTYEEVFAAGTQPRRECTLHEPAPQTEIQTDSVIIYPDIFEELIPETETQTETITETESETMIETDMEINTESEMETESNQPSTPDTSPLDELLEQLNTIAG